MADDLHGYAQIWRATVERCPDRAAIEVPCSRQQVSYAELHREALEIAAQLASEGVGAGSLLGLRLKGRREFCAGLLGAWLADAVPVPLSVTAPDSYIGTLARNIGMTRAIVDAENKAVRVIGDGSWTEPPERPPSKESLAYVMHTSGSTGMPKAVALSHRALVRYIQAFTAATKLTERDRFLQLSPTTFDVAFEELLPVWSVGGTAVLSANGPGDPRQLLNEIEARAVTVAEVTTMYWKLLLRYLRNSQRIVPQCLRLLLMGGENASRDLIQELLDRGIPLAHVYGATEAGITSTIAFFDKHEPVSAAWVGRPLSNSTIAVLHESGRDVADGTFGEVFIGGDSLAEEYLGDVRATERRFVTLSRGGQAPTRWYRTGDVGRLVGGSLEIVGRLDARVKVNGTRIDLTEIEIALSAQPIVAEAAVVPENRGSAAIRLIGFVTLHQHSPKNPEDVIRDALRQRLPLHLVPARIVVLDVMPLTPHGKIDRVRLARFQQTVDVPDLAGASMTEQLIAAAWATVIGQGPSSLDQGFYDAGGDSFDLLLLTILLDEKGITLTPTDCLVHPTIRAMATLVDGIEPVSTDECAKEHNLRRRERFLRRRDAHRTPE